MSFNFFYSLEELYIISLFIKVWKNLLVKPSGLGVVLRERFLIMDAILIVIGLFGIPVSLCIHFDKKFFINYQVY